MIKKRYVIYLVFAVNQSYDTIKNENGISLRAGFEPAREDPIRFQV